MDMQMEDGLSGAKADVKYGAVSLLDIALAGDLGGGQVAAADEFGIRGLGFIQSREMFFRNNQHMCGSLRVDVLEGEDVGIFIDFLGGNLAPEEAAEKATGSGISHGEFTLRRKR
jgi:hypothetical protein